MAKEFQFQLLTSETVYTAARNAVTGQVLIPSSLTFEDWVAAATYDIATTVDDGLLASADMPASSPVGYYFGVCYKQEGASPANGDPVRAVTEVFYWNGTAKIQAPKNSEQAQGGAGDHIVTLTIRETDGTPIPDVLVWLNTSDSRENAVAGSSMTNDSGEVQFFLTYGTTYYVFCHKAGYNFSTPTITPESGTVDFTKDIGTEAAAEATALSTGFIARALADVRLHTDEPTINSKYSDALILTKLEQAYPIILGEVYRNSRTPVVAKLVITVDSAKETYALPPSLGVIWAIYAKDTDNGTKFFYHSRGIHNTSGRGIWVEGRTLHIQRPELYVGSENEFTVEYTELGTSRLHDGVLAAAVNTAGDEVTLAAVPSTGTLDTRDNAYAGCLLRILSVTGTSPTGDYIQERVITDYNRTTRVATLDVALDPVPVAGAGGYIYYEIAPAINQGMDSVLALYAAYMIASIEAPIQKRAAGILAMYRDQLRNLRLSSYYTVLEDATKLRADCYDNNRFKRAY